MGVNRDTTAATAPSTSREHRKATARAAGDRPTDLELYTSTAIASAAPVIRRYSTSFKLATSLFPPRCRSAISSIYALVRVADEIVDGTAEEAGLSRTERGERLDEFERETERAVETGFSANLVIHAFAAVARAARIEADLTRAFFSSMRRDLDDVQFGPEEYERYIHGSAEVVGLMCLRVFLMGHMRSAEELAALEAGATRLGAAFQKVNFLRDLGHDAGQLGRIYLPGTDPAALTEAQKHEVITDIAADLDAAYLTVPLLPRDCRASVLVAADLFGELLRRIERTPASVLASTRVSVPNAVKTRIAVRRLVLRAGTR